MHSSWRLSWTTRPRPCGCTATTLAWCRARFRCSRCATGFRTATSTPRPWCASRTKRTATLCSLACSSRRAKGRSCPRATKLAPGPSRPPCSRAAAWARAPPAPAGSVATLHSPSRLTTRTRRQRHTRRARVSRRAPCPTLCRSRKAPTRSTVASCRRTQRRTTALCHHLLPFPRGTRMRTCPRGARRSWCARSAAKTSLPRPSGRATPARHPPP
mmetsp:Transcript_16651/g.53067  ORF Transcript_16651/g.53067 Transcript_16651/m.53067 type:complete len:215 (+) Transcript_16651:160-804(+)